MQLPSREGLEDDKVDSAVREESVEFANREGESSLVGEDRNGPDSSVSIFMEESRESLERAVDCRSSRASCSSN